MPTSLRAASMWFFAGWCFVLIVGFAISALPNGGSVSLSSSAAAQQPKTTLEKATIPAVEPPKKMLVIGDSYTTGAEEPGRQHNDIVGSERRGWWSFLADDLGYEPVLSAEPGSGMLKGGRTCVGDTFSDWIGDIAAVKPDLLLIEGGRNDVTYCDSQTSAASGRSVTSYSIHLATAEAVDVAARSYLRQVRAAVDEIGLSPNRVFVFSPWGELYIDKRSMITEIVADYAEEEGFNYIDVEPFSNAGRYDDTHPNGEGSEDLYEELLAESDLGDYRVD